MEPHSSESAPRGRSRSGLGAASGTIAGAAPGSTIVVDAARRAIRVELGRQRRGARIMLLFGALLLIATVGVLGVVESSDPLGGTGVDATATVARVQSSSPPHVVVDFVDRARQPIVARVAVAARSHSFDGKLLRIAYDPTDPTHAVLAGRTRSSAWIVIGAIAFLVAVGMIIGGALASRGMTRGLRVAAIGPAEVVVASHRTVVRGRSRTKSQVLSFTAANGQRLDAWFQGSSAAWRQVGDRAEVVLFGETRRRAWVSAIVVSTGAVGSGRLRSPRRSHKPAKR